MSDTHPLLINEPPLQVLPSLAKQVGLNQAIILQQLHYWVQITSNIRDDHKWVYNSYEEWQKQFPFWSTTTIKRALLSLEEQGLVISGVFNNSPWDKTKWYRIDYDRLVSPIGPSWPDQADQDGPISEANLVHSSLAETTTESTSREGVPARARAQDTHTQSSSLKKEITEEFRERMRQKYKDSLTEVDDRIDECLGYPTTERWLDKEKCVQRWLRKDAEDNAPAKPYYEDGPDEIDRNLAAREKKWNQFVEQIRHEQSGQN